MASLILKTLLGIGSAGIACAVPVSLYYGLKDNSGTMVHSSKNDSTQTHSTAAEEQQENSHASVDTNQPKISCREGDREVQMEYVAGSNIDSETALRLSQEMRGQDGQCISS